MKKARTNFSGGVVFALAATLCLSANNSLAGGPNEDNTFTIEKIETLPEKKIVKIHFTDVVDKDALQEKLRTVPPVYLDWWDSEMDLNVLALHGQFRNGTQYLLAMDETIRSRNNRPYRKTLNKFLMPDRPSRIEFTDPGTSIERDSRQMVHLDLVNVEEVLYEGVHVPPLLLPFARSIVDATPAPSARTLAASCESLSRNIPGDPIEREDWRPLAEAAKYDSHLFFSPLEKNIKTPFSVPLGFRDNREKGSLQFVWFRNNVKNATGQAGPRLLRITDIGISYKRSHENLLVWTTSLRTAEPVEGVSFLACDKQSKTYLLGKTDPNGLLEIDDEAEVPSFDLGLGERPADVGASPLPLQELSTLVARTDDDLSFVDLQPSSELKVDGIVQSSQTEPLSESVRSYLFTERGVYRPGETVHFKGTARRYADGSIGVPAESTCEVSIRDSKGNIAYQRSLAFSEFGTVFDTFPVETYAPLGTYTIALGIPGRKEEPAMRTFQVQEYRRPRHYAEVTFQRKTRRSKAYVNLEREEEFLEVTIGGRYYAGGPVKHGKVRWKIEAAPSNFPQDEYPDFVFGYPDAGEGEFIETGESILDETGEVTVSIPLGKAVLGAKHGLRTIATVVDFDGRTATKSGTFLVRPAYLVGLWKPPDRIEMGDGQLQRMVVLNASGERVLSGALEIGVMERSSIYTRKRNDEGNVYSSYTSVWRSQYSTTAPIVNGEAVFDFEFQNSGKYLVECTYRGAGGETSTSAVSYDVRGPWYWGDDWEKSHPFEAVQLLPDKTEYEPGETMRLLIRSRRRLSRLLLTVERDRILERRVIPFETEGEVAIPVTEEFLPNVYISALGVSGRGDFPTYQSDFDEEAPAFVFGTTTVKVRKQVEELNVVISPEGDEIRARPGDPMTLDLHVTSEEGDGVRAELAVGVLDEQVLALTGYETPDLGTLLDFVVPLSVFSGDLRRDLQNQTPYQEILNQPLTGGGGGPLGQAVGIQIRQDFNPVAYFNPCVVTDEQGRASVTFKFPDTMTAYRVYVVACDSGSRFKTVTKPAVVTKDFYLEPGLPRFLNRGDEFRFKVSAFNQSERKGAVQFQIQSATEVSMNARADSYPIGSFDRVLIPVEGTAEKAGSCEVTVSAAFLDLQDAVRVKIPVSSGFLLQRHALSGTLTGSGSITYDLPESTRKLSSDEVAMEDLQVLLTLSTSPFLRMKKGLSYLLDYPYGCVEQTSSRVLPLASLRSLVVSGLVPGIDARKVDDFLKAGVARLFSMQTGSGGFAYWPGQQNPSFWGTLYALTALTFAREAGVDVPQREMDNALGYLSDRMGNREPDVGDRGESHRGLAAYVLAKADRLSLGELERLGKDFETLNRESRLLTLLAAKRSGYWPDEEIAEKAREALLQKGSDRGPVSYNAAHREPAVALLAACTLLDATEICDSLAGPVLAAMGPEGRWTSTSDTGWALLSLGEYFRRANFPKEPLSGRVVQGDGSESAFNVDASKTASVRIPPMTFLSDPHLEVSCDRESTVSYELALTYPQTDVAVEGASQGFTIHKTIENTAGTDTIYVGDVVKVTVRVGMKGGEYNYLVLDDPLPAGLVAVNAALATEEPVEGDGPKGEEDYWSYWDPDGFYRLMPNYFEIRDDRVLAFRDRMWGGDCQYGYYARAVCAGTFRMPSTKVQLMYSPEVYGYTPESEIAIQER